MDSSIDYGSNATVGENSNPYHIVPAIVITIACVGIFLIIIMGFRMCAYVRKNSLTQKLSHIPSSSDGGSEPMLMLSKYRKPLSRTRSIVNPLQEESLNTSSFAHEEVVETEFEDIKICQDLSQSPPNDYQGVLQAGSEDFVIIEPNEKKEIEIEVEMHPVSTKIILVHHGEKESGKGMAAMNKEDNNDDVNTSFYAITSV